MTLMTEAEAWAFLADKWENYTTWCGLPAIELTDSNLPTTCLCHNVGSLKNMHMISATTANNMQDVINKHLQLTGKLVYAWPLNYEGAIERAKFCRKQAELLSPLTKLQQEEIKAWEIVVLHWENATENYKGSVTVKYDNQQCYGMCRFIEILLKKNIISEITLENMLSKIDDVLFEMGDDSYLASFTFEGAQVRIQFCRDQIQKIKQGR